MKCAVFLSQNSDLDAVAASVLGARGGVVDVPFAQLEESGQPGRGLFTWFGKIRPEAQADFREPPWVPADGVVLPDTATVDGYYVECRWEHQFADIAKQIAAASEQPVWVLDNDDVVWDAAAVDPERVRL